jgi:hypothetical protein
VVPLPVPFHELARSIASFLQFLFLSRTLGGARHAGIAVFALSVLAGHRQQSVMTLVVFRTREGTPSVMCQDKYLLTVV